MKRSPFYVAMFLLAACNASPEVQSHIEAAAKLTRDYAHAGLNAHAAGTDCLILLVRSSTPLDDLAIETMHYGTGVPTPYDGGLQQFAKDHMFRAVAYKDANGRQWTYGSVTREEAGSMPICR